MSSVPTSTGKHGTIDSSAMAFPGFEPLTANFLYCPNQFLEVCLPNYSRGVVRLVAYMLRRTLGWLDKEGNPIEQEITISYSELVTKAKVSRGAIAQAIEDAIEGKFIRCTQQGRASCRGLAARPAHFVLRWDEHGEYTKDPQSFAGFFAGEGHRTPVPNAFFDSVIPNETLTLTKIVGTVIRHTVGYQNQFGGKRSEAPLSYSYLQTFAGIRDRRALATALRSAIEAGYICCVKGGRFSPDVKRRRPARYGVRWLTCEADLPTGSKSLPVCNQSKISTSSGSVIPPANQSKNPTKEKTPSKDTCKQQAAAFQLLQQVGFDDRVARDLSHIRSLNEIERQIVWVEYRSSNKNRLGMLRKAIEENWSEPPAIKQQRQQQNSQARKQESEQQHAAKQQVWFHEDVRRRQRLSQIRGEFLQRPRDERARILEIVLSRTPIAFHRGAIRRAGIDEHVAADVLQEFDRKLAAS